MKSNYYQADIALLVLENPWDAPKGGTRRVTVLPFFEGLEKIHSNLAVYHSTFHDFRGLKAALELDLSHTQEPRKILYIGSHGSGRKMGNIRLADLKKTIQEYQLEGVIISSCEVCSDTADLEDILEETGIRWIIGYKTEVPWFDSMMIELTVLDALARQDADYKSKMQLLEAFFQEALGLINPQHAFPEGTLGECLNIVLCSRKGARPQALQWPTN